MGRLINSTYLSLDGIVQNPQNFTFEYRSDDATRYAHDLLFSADALLMGRHTYEGFAAYWPTAKDDDGSAVHLWLHPLFAGSNDAADLITHARSAARLELIDVTRCTSGLLIVSYRPTNTAADA